MFDVRAWLEEISGKVRECFGGRVVFIGFQGSYRRGEATVASDVDLVVILDELRIEDLEAYRKIVRSMPNPEKACGFISGRKEIQNWSKSDLFQFYFETEALEGSLNDIIARPAEDDIRRAVKSNSEALYHAACHSFVFDNDVRESLAALYKMTFFILQARYYLENGVYVSTKKELLPLLSGKDAEILEICINKDFDRTDVRGLYGKLIDWCVGGI